MIEILTLFVIMTALLLAPLWVFYRKMVSEETRSHLNALLLHDIIKALTRGLIRLIKGAVSLLVTGVKKLLGP